MHGESIPEVPYKVPCDST